MKKTINLSPLLEETSEPYSALYIVKLFLKEKEGIPIIIDPRNIKDELIEVESGNFEYQFLIHEGYELEYEYTPAA